MLKVEDPLVVALAQERIFLCEWAESTFRPVLSEKQRKQGEFPEVPEFALRILRCTLKSLSVKIKNAAAKNQEAELMIKAWYADHINWATTWAMMEASSITGPTMVSQPFSHQLLAIAPPNGPRQLLQSQPKGSGKNGKDKDFAKSKRPDQVNEGPTFKAPRLDLPSNGKPTFDEVLNSKDNKADISIKLLKLYPEESRTFWREYCRNCFISGQGLIKHSLSDCQKLGNRCLLRCAKCKAGNHWMSECTV